jgi:hypothetical protein
MCSNISAQRIKDCLPEYRVEELTNKEDIYILSHGENDPSLPIWYKQMNCDERAIYLIGSYDPTNQQIYNLIGRIKSILYIIDIFHVNGHENNTIVSLFSFPSIEKLNEQTEKCKMLINQMKEIISRIKLRSS